MSALIRDVTLRDGLQLTGGMLSTGRKLEVVRRLLDLGMPAVEVGSLARGDLVPSLANSLEVVRELTPAERARSWVWVATPRHVEKALAAGAVNLQYCLSVSDAHNQANLGRSTQTSMDGLPEAVASARAAGAVLHLCLATSFTCPFDGPVDPVQVLRLVIDDRAEGVHGVVICDTLGQAVPGQVSALVRATFTAARGDVVFHGHDTWGTGVANALAAIDAGASMVDGALAGLGGCPFAPGASGNTATEDLAFALRPDWLTPTSFAGLVELGEGLVRELGEPARSKAAEGARSKAAAFDWVIH